MKKSSGSLAVLCLFLPALALAHAHVKKSDPAKDAVLSAAPKKVSIDFSEDLELAMSKLEVKNSKTGETVCEGKVIAGPSGKNGLERSLKPLKSEKATYEVNWKAVSKDAHKMQGSYKFSVDPGAKEKKSE
ncbi:MAG: copper resistance protein CopC [Methylotenera sp.]|nr:copper resistance protein CopC [Oligoflexia bacterium]